MYCKCYLIICIINIISITEGLECGLSASQNQEDLKKYTAMCMMKPSRNEQGTEKTLLNQNIDSYDDESDSLEDVIDNRKSYNTQSSMLAVERSTNGLKEREMINNTENEENLNNTEISDDNCVIRCVFKQLGMIDPNGYPDHNKIFESLMRGVDNRELKDFLQDSANECFQMMEQVDHMDSCEFSTQLIKCLAEKGRSNCSDWPMTEFPFAHIF